MAIEDYLKALLQELNLDDKIYADEKKIYHLTLEDNLVIFVKDLNPGFYFLCQLMPVPEENPENIFMALMLGNLFGQGTGGSVIAIDQESNMLTLSFALPYRFTFQEFRNQLEDFTNYVDFWRREAVNIQEGRASILLP